MTERHHLIAAVAERPGDDATRLVLADWLDDHGETGRADFIRASVEAERLRHGTARRAELLDRAADLLAEHEGKWLGPWRERLIDWEFKRGFLQRVRMTANNFLRHGEEMFRDEPVGQVELVGEGGSFLPEDAIREVVGHPAFEFVRDCAVKSGTMIRRGAFVAAWMAALADNPRLTRLRSFGPVGNFEPVGVEDWLDERAFTAFCSAPHLARLRRLNLRAAPSFRPPPGRPWLVSGLARSTFARNLRSLTLSWCGLVSEGMRQLATAPVFGRLRHLEVSRDALSAADWQALFDSITLTSLSSLEVPGEHFPAYARSPLALRIRRLSVGWMARGRGERLQSAWRDLIARAPGPIKLELANHNPGSAVFREMCRAGWLRRVRELVIRSNSQGGDFGNSAGVRSLFGPKSLPRLAHLDLHEICDALALEALGRWPGLARLETLEVTDDYNGRLVPRNLGTAPVAVRSLTGVRITTAEEATDFLVEYPLHRLTLLGLSFCCEYNPPTRECVPRISPATAEAVLRSPRLARLAELHIGFDRVPEVEARVIALLADPSVLPGLRRLFCSGHYSFQNTPEVERLRARFGLRLW
jgi:uncharacterized protein (TIGR02996 family)